MAGIVNMILEAVTLIVGVVVGAGGVVVWNEHKKSSALQWWLKVLIAVAVVLAIILCAVILAVILWLVFWPRKDNSHLSVFLSWRQ